MTTIAYDHKNKVIAIDGRYHASDVILTDSAIKWRKTEEGVWFFCGAQSDESYLMSLSHNQKLNVPPNASALLIRSGKCILVCSSGEYCEHTELTCNHSIGSGWKFALSALKLGKSAKEAVIHASQMDIYTGGDIHVFCVLTGKQIDSPILEI